MSRELLVLLAGSTSAYIVAAWRWPQHDVASGIAYNTLGLVAFAALHFTVGVAFHAAMVAWWLWIWWRRRGKRDADRVLGVVRDLGHRLTVVNVPAMGGAR